jgi:5-methylcytosine-specific restriction endonuclease McrA
VVVYKRGINVMECERLSIFSRDGFSCVYCGRSQLEEGIQLYVSYKISESEEGKPVFDNLVTTCSWCKAVKKGSQL